MADATDLKKQIEKLNNEVITQKTVLSIQAALDNTVIELTLCEMAKRYRRASNVILFGVKENSSGHNEPDADLNKVVNMIKKGNNNIEKTRNQGLSSRGTRTG